MEKAIIGKKLGMTQIFSASGLIVPVTVVEAGPCTVTQKKTPERDGYAAVQLAFGDVKERKLTKAEAGHIKKAGAQPKKFLKEFQFSDLDKFEVGKDVFCDQFTAGDMVDVSGLTRGRGYTGAIKRWNQRRMKESHGTGPCVRQRGSLGSNSTPSRVYKGLHMAGQYGHENVTIQNLQVVKVDKERNVLLIKGAVPGPKGAIVSVRETVKREKHTELEKVVIAVDKENAATGGKKPTAKKA